MLRVLLLLLLATACASPLLAQPTARIDLPAAAHRVLAVPDAPGASVYATGDRLVFRTATGETSAPLVGTLVGTASGVTGRHVAVATLDEATAKEPALALRIYAADGTPRFEHSLAHSYDAPFPALAVDDATGAAAYARPAAAEIVFLSKHGEETARRALFEDAPYALERSLRLTFTPDGRQVLVAAMRVPAHAGNPYTDDNVHLFAFTADGTLRWREALPGQSLQALAVSDDGTRLAVSTYDAYAGDGVSLHTRVLDPAGGPLLDVPHGFEHAHFGEREVLLLTRRRAVTVDLGTAEVSTTYDAPSRDEQLVDGVLAPGTGRVTLLAGRATSTDGGFVYAHPRLVHLDDAGTVTATTDAPVAAAKHPALRASAAGVALVLDRSVLTYSWPSLR